MSEHSHLGASGAERWMHCPGSVALVQRFGKPDEQGDGPDYRWQGTVAHAAIADCLMNGLEAWEVVGREYEGHVLTADLAEGVAFYLGVVTPLMPERGLCYIEERLSAPDVHPALFGTVDLGFFTGTTLRIFDYKNGAGVSVDVENNPQEMYYAFLLLVRLQRDHPETFADRVKHVELTIVQPNDFNPAGKVRTWLTTPDHIMDWGYNTLVKAMCDTDKGADRLDMGPHCRFCPAKLICPAQQLLFAQLAAANPADAKQMTQAELDRFYPLIEPAKMFIKAIEEEMFAKLMAGEDSTVAKLVKKQADRVWKDEALQRLSTLFGTQAFTEPKLKSPAEMEKIPMAKPIVRELAFTPDTGLTVKPLSAKGLAVKPPKASALLAQHATEA